MSLGYCWRGSLPVFPPSPRPEEHAQPRWSCPVRLRGIRGIRRTEGRGAAAAPAAENSSSAASESQSCLPPICAQRWGLRAGLRSPRASETSQCRVGSSGIRWGHHCPAPNPSAAQSSAPDSEDVSSGSSLPTAQRSEGRPTERTTSAFRFGPFSSFSSFFLRLNFLLAVSQSGTDVFRCLDFQVKPSPQVLVQLHLPN